MNSLSINLLYDNFTLFNVSMALVLTLFYNLVIKPIYRINFIKNCINDSKNVITEYFPLIGGYKKIMFSKDNESLK